MEAFNIRSAPRYTKWDIKYRNGEVYRMDTVPLNEIEFSDSMKEFKHIDSFRPVASSKVMEF